ncbi:ankyrin [Canariomyces notabilis]|uniref:Ankyrin n=1 Tax=Canariomyces notabilis TaxID=2074819 RepID=A0AAN6TD23_9PEZI|nr:ankyrin [Canariomyces arenarius]
MYAGWFDCDGPDAYWDGWRGSYKDGVTALHEAARVGCLEIAHLLIDAGADVEAMDDDGITVLHEAATYTFSMQAFDLQPTGMVDLLLAHGADINAHYGPKKATVLHCVAAQGNVAMYYYVPVSFTLDKKAFGRGITTSVPSSTLTHCPHLTVI